jgi:hypothetical protein
MLHGEKFVVERAHFFQRVFEERGGRGRKIGGADGARDGGLLGEFDFHQPVRVVGARAEFGEEFRADAFAIAQNAREEMERRERLMIFLARDLRRRFERFLRLNRELVEVHGQNEKLETRNEKEYCCNLRF